MKTKAVRLYGKKDLRLETFELKELKDDEIRIEIFSDSVCMSTYKTALLGAEHMRVPDDVAENPIIIGHEFCGRITEVGNNVEKEIIGKRVVVETYVGCGKCEYCKSGQKHLCDAGEIGYPPYQGGEAEYVCVPRSCVHFLPDEITDDEAGIMEAAVCPFGAIMENDVKNKTVLVYGAGVAGLSFIQAAKVFGAKKVICVVRNDIINTWEFYTRKPDTCVDNDEGFIVFHAIHVFADLT